LRNSADPWPRVIAHADMDAFYAAVEQLDDPALRGRPVLVGPPSGRGVVLTASYEARPWRVGSAMPMALARRRCPEAVVVPPRFERYQEISAKVMAVFDDFSPVVEPLSLDEAFLDMTGSTHIFGPPQALGRRLKAAVRDATGGLTVSVGISGTKYVAKVASGYAKPDGLTIVPAEAAQAWLAPQPVAVLWGAGPKTQRKLTEHGLGTVGDVAACSEQRLIGALGEKTARHFHALALGRDPRPVESARRAKSLSSERTLNRDVERREEICFHLHKAAEDVARRLRRHAIAARGVRVKLKRSDFRILTRQHRLTDPTSASDAIYRCAEALLAEFDDPGPFRLIGVGAYELEPAAREPQLDLLAAGTERSRRLDRVLDEVAERFGPDAVRRARDLERSTVLEGGVNLDFLGDEPDAEPTGPVTTPARSPATLPTEPPEAPPAPSAGRHDATDFTVLNKRN
jgi:DNA polymerase-4